MVLRSLRSRLRRVLTCYFGCCWCACGRSKSRPAAAPYCKQEATEDEEVGKPLDKMRLQQTSRQSAADRRDGRSGDATTPLVEWEKKKVKANLRRRHRSSSDDADPTENAVHSDRSRKRGAKRRHRDRGYEKDGKEEEESRIMVEEDVDEHRSPATKKARHRSRASSSSSRSLDEEHEEQVISKKIRRISSIRRNEVKQQNLPVALTPLFGPTASSLRRDEGPSKVRDVRSPRNSGTNGVVEERRLEKSAGLLPTPSVKQVLEESKWQHEPVAVKEEGELDDPVEDFSASWRLAEQMDMRPESKVARFFRETRAKEQRHGHHEQDQGHMTGLHHHHFGGGDEGGTPHSKQHKSRHHHHHHDDHRRDGKDNSSIFSELRRRQLASKSNMTLSRMFAEADSSSDEEMQHLWKRQVKREPERFTLFFTKKFVFSNHYPCKNLSIDGMDFKCTEQYYMFTKAMVFGDADMAKAILQSGDPKEMKKLGSNVANFDEKVWLNGPAQVAMTTCSLLKYMQNRDLRLALFRTHGTTLVETNPKDSRWGIALAITDPAARDRSQWRGENWLGSTLTNIRERLWLDKAYEEDVRQVSQELGLDLRPRHRRTL